MANPQKRFHSVCFHVSVLEPGGRIVHVNSAWTNLAKENKRKGRMPLQTGIGVNYLKVLRTSKGKNAEEALPDYKELKR